MGRQRRSAGVIGRHGPSRRETGQGSRQVMRSQKRRVRADLTQITCGVFADLAHQATTVRLEVPDQVDPLHRG